ncbi:MAG: TetR/AcrR family transcriptional regulator [Candidatus Nanopelagicales bacterium]
MSGIPNDVSQLVEAAAPAPGDRRSIRRAQVRAEIVEAAWQLVRESGLARLSMRELGSRVGMRAQSVYSHFASKEEILDAMFRQGYQEYLESLTDLDHQDTAPAAAFLGTLAHHYFDFCVAEPVRFQLLFLRTVPGFAPSPSSYAIAIEAVGQLQLAFNRAGITDPAAPDLATAVMTGLASQQLANDPGGRRWSDLVDRAVSMLLTELAPDFNQRRASKPTRRSET